MTTAISSSPMGIGALAERTGLAVSAIRYYEEVGLIPPAQRRPSGHRVYDARVQQVLTLIRHCRDFGFSVEETRSLVQLSTSEERDCVEARDLAQAHLDTIRAKLTELRNLERSLARFVKSCGDECAGGPAARCTILRDLNAADAATRGSAAGACCG
jgi:DNA-binding transcriptional MerR regulator